MIYHIASLLSTDITALNVVHYISFRMIASLLTVLCISLGFGSAFIRLSQKFFRSKAREHTPQNHRAKDNIPTMGGLFILFVITTTVLLWCNLSRPEVWIFLFCLLSFGLIGFWDDWNKIKYSRGISERSKFYAQILCATLVTCAWLFLCTPPTTICIPFLKQYTIDLGYFIIPWAIFIIVGTSNAVNLTDGLDGLAIGSLLPNFATFAITAYLAGHYTFANYLHIPFAGTSEIAILGIILIGASLGFLWFNAYPAQIFMGDVGSLALGASLAFMALASRQEILLGIAGGLFVIETLSVIIQVTSYRLFKRRVFKMAPIHHHFELLGWPESKITIRFGIISCILCLIALMTLKLR